MLQRKAQYAAAYNKINQVWKSVLMPLLELFVLAKPQQLFILVRNKASIMISRDLNFYKLTLQKLTTN